MFVFSVRDMRVSGQAAVVLAAVQHVDEDASVLVNLSVHEVEVSQTTAGETELSDAIIHPASTPFSGIVAGARRKTVGRRRTGFRLCVSMTLVPYLARPRLSQTRRLPRHIAQAPRFERWQSRCRSIKIEQRAASRGTSPSRPLALGDEIRPTADDPGVAMPLEFVSLEYPPGSACPSRIVCKPVGKRRYAAWLGDEFLGHAIARVDGCGQVKRHATKPSQGELTVMRHCSPCWHSTDRLATQGSSHSRHVLPGRPRRGKQPS